MRSARAALAAKALTVTALAATVLLVSGCGGAAEINEAVGVGAPPGTEVAAVAPTEAVPATSPATDSVAFCHDLEQLQVRLPTLLAPGNVGATLQEVQALLARVQDDAPADIRPSVIEVVRTEDQLIKELSANPPDLAGVRRTFTAAAYQRALRELGLYAVDRC